MFNRDHLKNNDENRFKRIMLKNGSQILVDTKTGVEYYKEGSAIVLLVDADGKPKINDSWKNGEL